MNLYVYVLFQCMDWSGVVWIWRGVLLIVEGAMRSVLWDPTVVNHARVIQSDAYTDAETIPKIHHSFIHWFIDVSLLLSFFQNFTEIRKGSYRFRRTCWCHMSLFFEKKVWWIKSWNAFFVYMYSFCEAFLIRQIKLALYWQNHTSTSNVLWRHDWCHSRWMQCIHMENICFFRPKWVASPSSSNEKLTPKSSER